MMSISAQLTRRAALKAGIATVAMIGISPGLQARGVPASNAARWIDGSGSVRHAGQAFGLAWPRQSLSRSAALGQRMAAQDESGQAVPLQTWIMATWPDGSVKWTGHAVPAGSVPTAGLTVRESKSAATLPDQPVSVGHDSDDILIRCGDLVWTVAGSGDRFVRKVEIAGRMVISGARLVGYLADGPEGGTRQALGCSIDRVTIEQRGPVRAVIRIDGHHLVEDRAVLPFALRLVAFAGSDSLQIMHSFIMDLDPAALAIAGLGVAVDVPLDAAPLHDRHVRFALGEGRVLAEAVRPLTGLRRDAGEAVRKAQILGRAVPAAELSQVVAQHLERIPAWGEFRLDQSSADGFTLTKRTGPGAAWIDSTAGEKAPGVASLSSPAGGCAITQRWFRERYPSALSIRSGDAATGTITAWLWSPQAAPMDLRSYRTVMGMDTYNAQNEGLEITYEDYEPGWDDPRSIARTSELAIHALAASPEAEDIAALARQTNAPPRLLAEPKAVQAAGVFGPWSLPDRSTPARARIEDQLNRLVDFYDREVERRRWYGFWNHGDVMHTYDTDRHQWRYDIGGFAWANSELSPDLWLWYAALRSGDARTFRLAEAMGRHTSDVDTYHSGRFAGLGTRHGVQHFSDSSKQPRVSNAIYRRIHYYLTADERMGDILTALCNSDAPLREVEIGRKVPGRDTAPLPSGTIDMTFGTTWSVLCGAWLAQWERTGERRWRDRILAGMRSIAAMPQGWMTGHAPFDLQTGAFRNPGPRIAISHLNAVFGAFEVNAELLTLIDEPGYRRAWLEYCRYYNASPAEFAARFGQSRGGSNLQQGHSRLTAYAAVEAGDAALAQRAGREFWRGQSGLANVTGDPLVTLADGTVEWPGLSTNAAAQWGLAAIQGLALVPAALDETAPVPD